MWKSKSLDYEGVVVRAACDSDAADGVPAGDTVRLAPDFRVRALARELQVGLLPVDASTDLVSAADILYFVG